MNATDLDLLIGSAAAAFTAIGVGAPMIWRRRDRQRALHRAVEKLVRRSERQRVLWMMIMPRENPQLCYGSAQVLRKAIFKARTKVPSGNPGISEFDAMKQATEKFCTRYEAHHWSGESPDLPEEDFTQLAAMTESLKDDYVPALERLREMYHITAGQRSTRHPWLDDEVPIVLCIERPDEGEPA